LSRGDDQRPGAIHRIAAVRGIWTSVRSDPRRAGAVAFALAALASVAYVLWLGRGQTLIVDEWSYMIQGRSSSPSVLLEPHNGHLIVFPLLVLKALYSTVGLSPHLPYQLLAVLLNVFTAGLLYVFARRALDPLTALVPALLMLFCGGGWDAFVTAYQTPNLFAIAAGLSALMLVRRQDRPGDALACLALAVSLASVSVGIAFAAGILAALLLRGWERALRSAWVFLVPALLYGAWFLWSVHFREGEVTSASVGAVGSGVFDQLAAILGSMTGLAITAGTGDLTQTVASRPNWGPTLVVLAVRRRRPSNEFYVALATLGVYLVTVALALSGARVPDASRYIYMGTPLVLLVAIEAFRGLRPTLAWAAGLAVAIVLSLLANGMLMGVGGRLVRLESATNRGQLTALEIAREEVPDDFTVEAAGITTTSTPDMLFDAGTFFEFSSEFGSPAYSEAELETAPEQGRVAADELLARALPIDVQPGFDRSAGAPIEVTEGDHRRAPHGCALLVPAAGSEDRVVFDVPGGGFSYRIAPGEKPKLALRRFADEFGVTPDLPSGPGRVTVPADGSQRPWIAELVATSRVELCP
jgi:hypothetical protein